MKKEIWLNAIPKNSKVQIFEVQEIGESCTNWSQSFVCNQGTPKEINQGFWVYFYEIKSRVSFCKEIKSLNESLIERIPMSVISFLEKDRWDFLLKENYDSNFKVSSCKAVNFFKAWLIFSIPLSVILNTLENNESRFLVDSEYLSNSRWRFLNEEQEGRRFKASEMLRIPSSVILGHLFEKVRAKILQ